MVTKREVLESVAGRTRAGKTTDYRDLAWQLDLTEDAACDHLKRLWQQRLIECTETRPRGHEYRLHEHEGVRELRFALGRRGRARLRWWREQEEREAKESWW